MSADELLRSLDPSRPDSAALEALTEAALDEARARFDLRLPDVVDLAKASRLPALALSAGPSTSTLPVDDAGVVIVTHLEAGVTLAATWALWKKPARTDSALEDDDDGGKVGFSVAPFRADLRARLPELPWRPGHLIARLVVRDQMTAPSYVTLDGGDLTRDADVRAYLDWVAAQQPSPQSPAPTAIQTDYQRDAWTPEVPAQAGLALVIQKVSLARRGDSLVLRGAYNLPVGPRERVVDDAPERADVEPVPVVARVTVTVVIVGHRTPGPAVLTLPIDAHAFAEPGPDGRAHVAGVFRCELFAHPAMPRGLQRYSVYAFAQEHMTGPLALTLVSENLVPVAPPR